MQKISAKNVVSYMTLPAVVPRVRTLFVSGFGYIAFLMAQIYFMARLLPKNHPYLESGNIGRFGIRHVMAEAANRIVLKKENIDQILIFVALLTAVVILFIQFLLLIISFFDVPAMAFSFFDTPNPEQDIAFTILDNVFGIPDMYCSLYDASRCPDSNPDAAAIPPFHVGFHTILEFYSTGILLIGVLIFLYFIIVIIAETAVTGTPFGQRFQNVWVPVRLAVAMGLLIPLQYGFSSGQYIVLYAAKFGSSMATVGWTEFNEAIASHSAFGGSGDPTQANPTGEPYSLVAIPQQADVTPLVEAMSLVHACAFSYLRSTPGYDRTMDYTDNANDFMIKPYLIKNKSSWMEPGVLSGTTIPVNPDEVLELETHLDPTVLDAIGFYYGGDIIIRFGQLDEATNEVKPLCGDIRVPVADIGSINESLHYGPGLVLQKYFYYTMWMWFKDEDMKQFARSFVTLSTTLDEDEIIDLCSDGAFSGCGTAIGFPSCAMCPHQKPSADWKQDNISEQYQPLQNDVVIQAWSDFSKEGVSRFMEDDIMSRGWGGAGIWYNKIAQLNGAFMDSVAAVPTMSQYPLVMEQIKEAKMAMEADSSSLEIFCPTIKAQSAADSPDLDIPEGPGAIQNIGKPLCSVYEYWNADLKNPDDTENVVLSKAFEAFMNLFFGTSGIVSIRGANAHIHPLAQLVAVGKGLVNNAIQNMAVSVGSAFLGGILSVFEDFKAWGGLSSAISQMALSAAFIGLTAGIVLFYVLPFMPFLYFFFAIGSWVKSIFEAIIGVPLWALAHLRIDGEGLPGDAAQGGYFLILDIFLRPILAVVGLIAAITIFSAQVRVLNFIWDMVVGNVTGAGEDILGSTSAGDFSFKRDVIDQFFFTIIYTVICYMLAMSSFKLIDMIPDNLLRWMGAGVSAFGDINQDPAVGQISDYAVSGSMTVGTSAAQGIRDLSTGLGSSLAKAVKG